MGDGDEIFFIGNVYPGNYNSIPAYDGFQPSAGVNRGDPPLPFETWEQYDFWQGQVDQLIKEFGGDQKTILERLSSLSASEGITNEQFEAVTSFIVRFNMEAVNDEADRASAGEDAVAEIDPIGSAWDDPTTETQETMPYGMKLYLTLNQEQRELVFRFLDVNPDARNYLIASWYGLPDETSKNEFLRTLPPHVGLAEGGFAFRNDPELFFYEQAGQLFDQYGADYWFSTPDDQLPVDSGLANAIRQVGAYNWWWDLQPENRPYVAGMLGGKIAHTASEMLAPGLWEKLEAGYNILNPVQKEAETWATIWNGLFPDVQEQLKSGDLRFEDYPEWAADLRNQYNEKQAADQALDVDVNPLTTEADWYRLWAIENPFEVFSDPEQYAQYVQTFTADKQTQTFGEKLRDAAIEVTVFGAINAVCPLAGAVISGVSLGMLGAEIIKKAQAGEGDDIPRLLGDVAEGEALEEVIETIAGFFLGHGIRLNIDPDNLDVEPDGLSFSMKSPTPDMIRGFVRGVVPEHILRPPTVDPEFIPNNIRRVRSWVSEKTNGLIEFGHEVIDDIQGGAEALGNSGPGGLRPQRAGVSAGGRNLNTSPDTTRFESSGRGGGNLDQPSGSGTGDDFEYTPEGREISRHLSEESFEKHEWDDYGQIDTVIDDPDHVTEQGDGSMVYVQGGENSYDIVIIDGDSYPQRIVTAIRDMSYDDMKAMADRHGWESLPPS